MAIVAPAKAMRFAWLIASGTEILTLSSIGVVEILGWVTGRITVPQN